MAIARHGALALACLCVVAFASNARADEAPTPAVPKGEGQPALIWPELPALPDDHGFAGPFVGVSNDALIVAGGANFPGGRPWERAKKIWHDAIFVLEDRRGQWKKLDQTLPRETGYGVALTWRDKEGKDAIVCIGGNDANEHFAEAYLMRYDAQRLTFYSLPDLPQPVAYACGAMIGDVVYIAGGQATPTDKQALHTLYSLDLSKPSEGWKSHDPWPGRTRILAVAGEKDGSLYLFSGAELYEGDDGKVTRRFLKDAYRYTPSKDHTPGTTDAWKKLANMPHATVAAPSPALPLGVHQLAIVGGDDGESFFKQAELKDAHPGFRPDVLCYHTVTDTWIVRGRFPKDLGDDPGKNPNAGYWPVVTTPTVQWRGMTIFATGEVRPGVRTPRVHGTAQEIVRRQFGTLNWLVLGLYLLLVVCIGLWFARRGKTTDDFFLAGKRIPWWAAGISIFGTQLSAITYLSIPATTFASDWTLLLYNFGILLVAPIIIVFFLPIYRRLNITTIYEYLERRFSASVRKLGAAAFTVFQLGRMGIVLLLPAIALAAVTGLDVYMCIILMGVLATIYTTLGGIEAVIWTDVIQTVVMLGGAVIALLIMLGGIEGGAAGAISQAAAENKFNLVNFNASLTSNSLLVLTLGAIFVNLVPYASDQAVVQRYLTTKTDAQAKRAVWTNAILAIPASLLFFAVGTALFLFYKSHPAELGALDKPDQVFPLFIAHQMPAGVAGLVIAGVFAAAMSSLDSSMHSMSTVLTTDFYRKLRRDASEKHYLSVARGITLVLGIAGTASALLLATWDIQSLWTLFLSIVGLLGGTMAGLFTLGVFTRRTGAAHAWLGAIASIAVLVFVSQQKLVHGLLYAPIGILTCVFIGAITAMIAPRKTPLDAELT